MYRLYNTTIITNIVDFIGETTCPIAEAPETFYLKHLKTFLKMNKCARYCRYEQENYSYRTDVYNDDILHIIKLDMPEYKNIIAFERDTLI